MPPRLYSMDPDAARPASGPAGAPVVQAPASAGVGLTIPPRVPDCSGVRPSWYPFQINVCDAELDPEDRDLSWREQTTLPSPL